MVFQFYEKDECVFLACFAHFEDPVRSPSAGCAEGTAPSAFSFLHLAESDPEDAGMSGFSSCQRLNKQVVYPLSVGRLIPTNLNSSLSSCFVHWIGFLLPLLPV